MSFLSDLKQIHLGYCSPETSIRAFMAAMRAALWQGHKIRSIPRYKNDSLILDISLARNPTKHIKAVLESMGWREEEKFYFSTNRWPVFTKEGAWFLAVMPAGTIHFIGEHATSAVAVREHIAPHIGLEPLGLACVGDYFWMRYKQDGRTQEEIARAMAASMGAKYMRSHHYDLVRAPDCEYRIQTYHNDNNSIVWCGARPLKQTRWIR